MPAQVNFRACMVSGLKMVACLLHVNSNVEVCVIDGVLMHPIVTDGKTHRRTAHSLVEGLMIKPVKERPHQIICNRFNLGTASVHL